MMDDDDTSSSLVHTPFRARPSSRAHLENVTNDHTDRRILNCLDTRRRAARRTGRGGRVVGIGQLRPVDAQLAPTCGESNTHTSLRRVRKYLSHTTSSASLAICSCVSISNEMGTLPPEPSLQRAHFRRPECVEFALSAELFCAVKRDMPERCRRVAAERAGL